MKAKRPYRFRLSLAEWVERHRLSPESKAKMSASLRGRSLSLEHRQKLSAAHRGRPASIERNQKIATALRGHVTSEETKAKIAAALRGRKLTPEHRAKIAAGGIGRSPSEETRRKLRLAAMARPLTPSHVEHLHRMRDTNTGKRLSAEHRCKIAFALSGRTFTAEHLQKIRDSIKRRRESGSGYTLRAAVRYTSLARQLHAILANRGLTLEPEVRFGRYSVDLYDREHHVAYEADGQYWHDKYELVRPGYHVHRDDYLLEKYGLPVMRFSDKQIRALWKQLKAGEVA